MSIVQVHIEDEASVVAKNDSVSTRARDNAATFVFAKEGALVDEVATLSSTEHVPTAL